MAELDSFLNDDPFADLHCPACNYDLTGLTKPLCPECGVPVNARELQRARGGHRLRRRITGVALVISSGFLLWQVLAELYIHVFLLPRLKPLGTTWASYEGDLITETSVWPPLVGHIALMLMAFSTLFRSMVRNDSISARRSMIIIILGVVGSFILMWRFSRALDPYLGL